MDFTGLFTFDINWQWLKDNASTIILGTCVFIQWIALQAFAVHYYFFRQSLKRPRPDHLRFATIEKVISFQSEHIDKIYGKLAHFDREIDLLHVNGTGLVGKSSSVKEASSGTSLEASYATLGELNLKKRIQEMQGPTTPQ